MGSQYVCFYVKLKLIGANLRIIHHFQTGAAAAHTGGLCGAVMQPVAGGGYVALRRRRGRQTRAYAPRSTVREVWVHPGHHSTLTTAFRMFLSSWCEWTSRAAPARFRAAHGWWDSCAMLTADLARLL